MSRPDPGRNLHVAGVMNLYDVDETIATKMLEFAANSYDSGREEGRKEAQRFFRLALGVEVPDPNEAALWNNPVPLKKDDEEED